MIGRLLCFFGIHDWGHWHAWSGIREVQHRDCKRCLRREWAS